VDEWLKVIVPIVITGLGAIVIGLFSEVERIKETQIEGKTWTYRIEQNELKINKLQEECK